MRTMKRSLAWILALVMTLCLGATGVLADDQIVLLDNDMATITVTGFDPEGRWGQSFELLLENKSSQNLRFRMEQQAINDVMCDAYWSESVPAGKKVYSSMEWDYDDLAFAHINYIEHVHALIELEDDDYNTLLVQDADWKVVRDDASDEPNVSPYESASGFVPVEVLNGDDFVCTLVDYIPDGSYDGGPQIVFYMENHTDASVHFTPEDVSVNGFMCDPSGSLTVAPGKVGYCSCEWWLSDLQASHIDSVEDIEFTMEVWDEETYRDITASQPVSVNVLEGGGQAPAEAPEAPAAEEPAAEQAPAEEPAPAPDAPAAAASGTVVGSYNGNVYTNDYFGVICTLPDGWIFTDEGTLAAGMGIDQASFALITEEMIDQAFTQSDNLTIMEASGEGGLQTVGMQIQSVEGLGQLVTEDELVDMIQPMLAESFPDNCVMEKKTFTLAGEEHSGLRINYVDNSVGVELSMYMDLIMILQDDYAAQVLLASALTDNVSQIGAFFQAEQ